MQTLIFLNGFAASGKSTLAKMYTDSHKLALNLEGDVLIAMLGQWRENWQEASQLKLQFTESLVRTHLANGLDVILPFLMTSASQAKRYEQIAKEAGAMFCEVYLKIEKEEAIQRLYQRGTWGEEGLPPLTQDDLPEIGNLYDRMASATSERTNMHTIYPHFGAPEETYQELLQAVSEASP